MILLEFIQIFLVRLIYFDYLCENFDIMTIHDFARNVKFYCEERDMSKAELAEKIGIKPASLARALHGNPQLDTIIKIADALEVPVANLFRESRRVDGIAYIGNELIRFNSIEELEKEYKKTLLDIPW